MFHDQVNVRLYVCVAIEMLYLNFTAGVRSNTFIFYTSNVKICVFIYDE